MSTSTPTYADFGFRTPEPDFYIPEWLKDWEKGCEKEWVYCNHCGFRHNYAFDICVRCGAPPPSYIPEIVKVDRIKISELLKKYQKPSPYHYYTMAINDDDATTSTNAPVVTYQYYYN